MYKRSVEAKKIRNKFAATQGGERDEDLVTGQKIQEESLKYISAREAEAICISGSPDGDYRGIHTTTGHIWGSALIVDTSICFQPRTEKLENQCGTEFSQSSGRASSREGGYLVDRLVRAS